jgi:hypothetical protein
LKPFLVKDLRGSSPTPKSNIIYWTYHIVQMRIIGPMFVAGSSGVGRSDTPGTI